MNGGGIYVRHVVIAHENERPIYICLYRPGEVGGERDSVTSATEGVL